uniref:Alpha N-terminal protein methyltransferase 1 n=1 Tax=Coccolithus braarudii TaxID=221442 RepID=A0A7S0LJ52_9EUKA|mmetsp:Transcript_43357/g.92304  ORF Transcript_43357/g.92304 Transcript_43357/m.92304 type:complete len:266 (+) Transcript_43357:271-1068(+)
MSKRARLADQRQADVLPWHVPEEEWYASTLAHWTTQVQAETNDGVLGGYGDIHSVDSSGSLDFIAAWHAGRLPAGGESGRHAGTAARELSPIPHARALDCGAGIGRVSDGVLLHVCEHVELVEVSPALLESARSRLARYAPRVSYTSASLREFEPPAGAFDLVWLQWVLGHLTDTDVLALLRRCRASLRTSGAIVVKDNNAVPSDCEEGNPNYCIDTENASVCRSHAHLRALFKRAKLRVINCEQQLGFPRELHAVRMYLLVPAT